MGDIPNRANWCFDSNWGEDILSNKQELAKTYIGQMLANTLEMFEYDGLPESIPSKEIEILHQLGGHAVWKDVNGKLYVFHSGLGGVLNEYYHPTRAIISNPYLNYTADLEIDKECVVTFNDKLRRSSLPMFNKYALLLAECDISIRFALINARLPHIAVANDDNTKNSIDAVFKHAWDGDKIDVALSSRLLDKDGMFTADYGRNVQSNIKDLMEMRQYLKSSWFYEYGIPSNYNMKRESLNSSETTMDESVLLPLIDDMLEERKIGLKKVNAMFGTNITVRLSSSWLKIREEIQNELKKQESETKQEETKEETEKDIQSEDSEKVTKDETN